MADATETLIAVIEKNKTEQVRVRLAAWRGSNFVDLRVFAEFDGTDGEKRLTKRGLALGLTRPPELVTALQAALTEAKRKGLIEGGEP